MGSGDPSHLTMVQELLEEISWGTKGNGDSQPVPRATGGWRAARYCCFHPSRLGAVQKWGMMCQKVTWQMSPKSGLDPTAFIPSPRHLRSPLHIAVGSHGPVAGGQDPLTFHLLGNHCQDVFIQGEVLSPLVWLESPQHA